MKKFLVLIAMLCCSGFAIAQIDSQESQNSQIQGIDLESNECSVTVFSEEVRFFNNENDSRNNCRNLYNQFSVNRGCFIRGHNDGRWESNFAFRRVFRGNNWNSDYNNWHSGRYNHRVQFNNYCQGNY